MAGLICSKCGNPLAGSNCSLCGLPPELCSCKVLEQQVEKIRVFTEKRKFNKPTTIIEGVTGNVKDVVKQLKSALACGGTFKENHIELMGDHKARVLQILVKLGYDESQIEVI